MFEGGQVSFRQALQPERPRVASTTTYGDLPTATRSSKHITWAGAAWSGVPGNHQQPVRSSELQGRLEPVLLRPRLHPYAESRTVTLNPGLHFYHTQDTGKALAGRYRQQHLQPAPGTVGVDGHTASRRCTSGSTAIRPSTTSIRATACTWTTRSSTRTSTAPTSVPGSCNTSMTSPASASPGLTASASYITR
jgi:hypothetical protein